MPRMESECADRLNAALGTKKRYRRIQPFSYEQWWSALCFFSVLRIRIPSFVKCLERRQREGVFRRELYLSVTWKI